MKEKGSNFIFLTGSKKGDEIVAHKSMMITKEREKELFIYSEEDKEQADKKRKNALNKGYTVMEEGREQWQTDVPVVHSWDEDGSPEFVWAKDGNRILCNRVIKFKREGVITEKVIRQIYRDFAKIFD